MKREIELHSLGPQKGARKTRRRVGRGNASGAGRTSARGEKGQKARAGGGTRIGFEGGQMPLYRRIPKFGFTSRKKIQGINQYQTISLDTLNRFDDGAIVDPESISAIGYAPGSKQKAGIKVLGSGELTKKLTVKVHAVTSGAKAKIESAGGSVELIGQ